MWRSPRTAVQLSCRPTLCGNAGAQGKVATFKSSCRNSTSSRVPARTLRAHVSSSARYRHASELAQASRALPVEGELLFLEQRQRRVDRDLVRTDVADREREEPVRLVAAGDLHAERAAAVEIEQEVDRTPQLDAAKPHRQHQKPLTPHPAHAG